MKSSMNSPLCIFCEIITGRHPSYLIYEDAKHMVFLDHRPVFAGHCLVIPKNHVDTFEELPKRAIAPLFGLVQQVLQAVEKGLPAEGAFIAINNKVSQSVSHVHVHIIPRNKGDGLRGFFWPRRSDLSEADMQLICQKIKKHIIELN